MYEAEIDLNNVIRDANYVHRLEADVLARMINVLQAVHDRGQASYLLVTGGKEPIRKLLKQRKAELQNLKSSGFKTLKNVDKFEIAQRLDEYFSAYQTITGYSHNDISSLQQRHIRDKDGDTKIVIFDHINWKESASLIDLSTDLLCGATRLVHEFFDSAFHSKARRIWQEFQNLRKNVHD